MRGCDGRPRCKDAGSPDSFTIGAIEDAAARPHSAATRHKHCFAKSSYALLVAYDEALAERIRALAGEQPGLTEKKMFGGLAFLVGGNMAIAASGQGGVLVRVDPAESDALVAGSNAEVAVMRGRPMPGWLRVEVENDAELADWVDRGVTYARGLPPKR